MAATENLSQLQPSHNSIVPPHGVITLHGYGIDVRVESGHLLIKDGMGAERTGYKLARVGHRLKRLVVVGSDGVVSLAALRWLADQNAAFVMLERDGKVLATTGPVRPSDAKLRRAQALAAQSEIGLQIARELISRKLAGQEHVSREVLRDSTTADEIGLTRKALASSESVDVIRSLESSAAAKYWGAWRDLPVTFPTKDLPRVPGHWRTFGTRKSMLTGSPRLAVTPANSMLNYLYSVLASESRLSAAAVGLDPGLGFLHVDTPARDSLACDIMEAVRPQIDRYVLTWILSQPLHREWFFEQRDGNCRLMASFASRLAETVEVWRRAVAPVAEWIVQQLLPVTQTRRTPNHFSATRLTQNTRRVAQGGATQPETLTAPRIEKTCLDCGKPISRGQRRCDACVRPVRAKWMIGVAQLGRMHANGNAAQASRSATQQRHNAAVQEWKRTGNPLWLTDQVFREIIRPRLTNVRNSVIARTLGVSFQYASSISKGKKVPHPRHWQALARLTDTVA